MPGKIDASLNNKLQAVKWGEYKLGDLFEIENTLSFNADKLVPGNDYDYVTRTQVLHCPYTAEKAKLVVREMCEQLALDLVDRCLVTDQIVLTVGYDRGNLEDQQMEHRYQGEVTTDRYGRKIPKHAHGTANLETQTSSAKLIVNAVLELYDRIINQNLLIRRVALSANHVVNENSVVKEPAFEQLDLFTDYNALKKEREAKEAERQRERKLQQAMLDIKKKYGKNAILKGTSLVEGATAMDRNQQIGGHKA